ncbi:MAG: tRNA uridine(34) 5-carboxymethylaminomethyl modification radical SAM/GNAT enzyme Elp3 [Nanoarchaeota archaeon]|nr:tRNA uridine(34) 5-carboxymethylaminomethyl modification radical SAM/GNAT enzyme Elp3 [Nanoarchaeota archaeon]
MQLEKLRLRIAKKFKLNKLPKNIDISLLNNKFKVITKPTRTISGVAPVAVMTKPYNCPHSPNCSYCPGGLKSSFGDIPKSYTGHEPASMRAKRNNYDPYLQVFNRLEHYILLNQIPEKTELIIMGGTFPSFSTKYQDSFVENALKALNDFSSLFFKDNKLDIKKFKEFFELPCDVSSEVRTKRLQRKILLLKKSSSLKKEQLRNEVSKLRCVGLAIETRADFGKLEHGNQMLKLGCTRIELGVQSVYDDVLKEVKRGHLTKDNIESIRILKDLGFKICAHYMVGLPLTDKKRDLEGFKKLFSDSDYKPDMLKIYPCMVMPGTELYKDYKSGKFNPITTEAAAELIAEFKKYVPTYCRIQRIQRDIPSKLIIAGVDKTNLRQYIHEKFNVNCRCIRCREIGHALNKNPNLKLGEVKILINHYKASEGDEFFISAEDVANDLIIGFCRMRFPSQSLREEIIKDAALIRELHVYSSSLQLGKKSKNSFQHRGYGKKLLETAENIAKKHNKKKIVIISGIGVRDYYRQHLNYKREGPYMIKHFI